MPTPTTPNSRTAPGTGFTNYDDLINANQGTAQGLGTVVGKGLQSQADAVNSDVSNQTSQFQTGLTNANNQFNNVSAYANQLAQMGSAGNWAGIAGNSGTAPTQTASTTDSSDTPATATNTAVTGAGTGTTSSTAVPQGSVNLNALSSSLATGSTASPSTGSSNGATSGTLTGDPNGAQFNAYTYTGPTGLSNASKLTDESNAASAVGRQAASNTGQEALLKQDVGGQDSNYSQGMSQFDQALLQKYGQSQVNQGRNALSDVSTNANNAQTQATSQAQNAAANVTAQKGAINTQLNNTENNLNNIGTAATAQNAQYAADLSALAAATAPGGAGMSSLTPQQLQDLQVIAQNPSQYIQGADTTTLDTGNGTTALTALAQILGQPGAQIGGPTFTNDQYGAYNTINSFLGNPNPTPANPSTYTKLFDPNYNTALTPINNADTATQQTDQTNINNTSTAYSNLTNLFNTGKLSGNVGAQNAQQIVNQVGAIQATGGAIPIQSQAYTDANNLTNVIRDGQGQVVNGKPNAVLQQYEAKLQSDLSNLQNYYAQQQQETNSSINQGTMTVAQYLQSLINPKAAPPALKST